MRLIQTCTGLLSIIGAAFLFATVHAIVGEPINLDPVVTKTEGEVKGDPNRNRATSVEEDPAETNEPSIRDIHQKPDEPADAGNETGVDIDALLDAPVPEGMLTLRQSHDLWEQGAYFVDARHEHEFEAGHIQYASWLPSTLFDTDSDRAFAVVDSMPMDATVVIYCVGGECDASKNTARRLQQIGFSDLRIMGVGYSEWAEAGFETSTGGEP